MIPFLVRRPANPCASPAQHTGRRAHWRAGRNAAVAAAMMLAAAACRDDLPTVHGPAQGPKPRAYASGQQIGTFNIPIPPNTSGTAKGAVPWTSTGITIAGDTAGLIRVRVSGRIKVTVNSNYFTNFCNHLSEMTVGERPDCPRFGGIADKSVGPGGWDGDGYQNFRVSVRVQKADGSFAGVSLAQSASDTSVYEGWTAERGLIQVSRTGDSWGDHIWNNIGPFPALDLAADGGSQTISAVNVGPLFVNAFPARVEAGDSARFSATANGGSITSRSWIYMPGDTLPVPAGVNPSGQPVTGCANTNFCAFVPSTSGRMYVTGEVDGHGLPYAASAVVWVLPPCDFFRSPTGDSLLDNPDVQLALREWWHGSYRNGSPPNRREQGGYIYRSLSGALRIESAPNNGTNQERCNIPLLPQPRAGETVVAILHTHPDVDGDTIPPDGSCNGIIATGMGWSDGPSGLRTDPSGNKGDWPSLLDFISTFGTPIAGYVIDRDHVHRYGPDLPAGDSKNKIRRKGTCQ